MKPLLNRRRWPTSETVCGHCGEKIIFLTYTDATKKEKRSIPRYHTGTCRETKRVVRARININKQKRRRSLAIAGM